MTKIPNLSSPEEIERLRKEIPNLDKILERQDHYRKELEKQNVKLFHGELNSIELTLDYFSNEIFFDIGAGQGLWSIVAIMNQCFVVSFDPLPEDHVPQEWHHHHERVSSSVGAKTDYKHNIVSIDDFVKFKKIIPQTMKIDVEGDELKVLKGATKVLKKYRPNLIIETHDHLKRVKQVEKFLKPIYGDPLDIIDQDVILDEGNIFHMFYFKIR